MNLPTEKLLERANNYSKLAQDPGTPNNFSQANATVAIALASIVIAQELKRLNDKLDTITGESSLFVQG